MGKTKKLNEVSALAQLAVEGILEKKGSDIVSMDLRNVKHAVTDYFIICHAESTTQVGAIARSVEEEIYKATGEDPWHKEGFQNAEWILLDYVNVVVHIFQKEKRDFYAVESLWADAEVLKIASNN